MENKITKTNQKPFARNLFYLCFCAIMIALGTVLSFVKVFQMPFDGSVTLCSMLPLMLISYFCGLGWGMVSAFIFSLIQGAISLGAVMSWGMSTQAVVACILLDYIVAYTAVGLTGIFKKQGATTKSHLIRFSLGALLAVSIRFVSHVISGIVLFSSWAVFEPAWLYSICYNGAFLLPDLIICVVIGLCVFTPLRKLFEKMDKTRKV